MLRVYRAEKQRWYVHFICREIGCNFILKKWGNLFDHLRIHSGDKPFQCPAQNCLKGFAQKSNLTKHIRTHKQPYLKCHLCGIIQSREKMVAHFYKHYANEDFKKLKIPTANKSRRSP